MLDLAVILSVLFAGLRSAAAADAGGFDGTAIQSVIYDASGGAPMAKAAGLLQHDLTSLCGRQPAVTSSFDGAKGNAVIDSSSVISLCALPRRGDHPMP